MRYSSWVILLVTCLAVTLPAWAGTTIKLAPPPVQDSLPRSYRDLHPASGISLTLLNSRNFHREVNPIFTDDWALPSFDIKSKQSGVGQTFVGDTRSFGKDDRLARLTAYWVGEDPYTSRHMSSTGVHLHVGHCAVDPTVIPYGSVVQIPGVGVFLAVDTGSAVVSRQAARVAGHTTAERGALVVDLFFETQTEGEEFAAHAPPYVTINWWAPSSTNHKAKLARSAFADEDWNKIYSKQL